MVVDASAILELLLRREQAAVVEANMRSDAGAAPDLVNAEVLQSLRMQRKVLGPERSREILDDFSALPITRYPTLRLVERAWALHHNFTAYDAMYVALAESVDGKLMTADARLSRAVRAHTKVEVILVA